MGWHAVTKVRASCRVNIPSWVSSAQNKHRRLCSVPVYRWVHSNRSWQWRHGFLWCLVTRSGYFRTFFLASGVGIRVRARECFVVSGCKWRRYKQPFLPAINRFGGAWVIKRKFHNSPFRVTSHPLFARFKHTKHPHHAHRPPHILHYLIIAVLFVVVAKY